MFSYLGVPYMTIHAPAHLNKGSHKDFDNVNNGGHNDYLCNISLQSQHRLLVTGRNEHVCTV